MILKMTTQSLTNLLYEDKEIEQTAPSENEVRNFFLRLRQKDKELLITLQDKVSFNSLPIHKKNRIVQILDDLKTELSRNKITR